MGDWERDVESEGGRMGWELRCSDINLSRPYIIDYICQHFAANCSSPMLIGQTSYAV